MPNYSRIMKISQVTPRDAVSPEGSKSEPPDVCLTIDTDFASAEVIQHTTSIFSEYGLPFTLFCTDANVSSVAPASLGLSEIGLHPNFRRFFEAPQHRPESPAKLISELIGIFPNATAVRSHSLVRSSTLSPMFRDFGLTHESNVLISPPHGAQVFPWQDYSGLVQVPLIFSDDVYLAGNCPSPTELQSNVLGLQTYLFHPIHVFLNSDNPLAYQKARQNYTDLEFLSSLRGSGRGTEYELRKLLDTLA